MTRCIAASTPATRSSCSTARSIRISKASPISSSSSIRRTGPRSKSKRPSRRRRGCRGICKSKRGSSSPRLAGSTRCTRTHGTSSTRRSCMGGCSGRMGCAVSACKPRGSFRRLGIRNSCSPCKMAKAARGFRFAIAETATRSPDAKRSTVSFETFRISSSFRAGRVRSTSAARRHC